MKAVRICVAVLVTALTTLSGNKLLAQDSLRIDLSQALEIALNENPTIKIADKEIKRVSYVKGEAKSALYPNISASAGVSHNLLAQKAFFPAIFLDPTKSPGEFIPIKMGADNTLNAGATLAVPVFSMGIYKSIQLSELGIEMALEQARMSRIDLKNQVERAFYTLLLNSEVLDVTERSLKNLEENYRNIKLKFEQGKVAEFDKIRAEVQVSNILPSYHLAINNLQLAELQLKMLMNVDLSIPIAAEGLLSDFDKDYLDYNPISEFSLDKNSDLQQLDIQAKLLDKQLQLQRTNRYPSLIASVNFSYLTQANDFNVSNFKWIKASAAGLTLKVPIFNGFINNYKDRQIKVNMNKLDLQKEYAINGLTVQAKNAWNSMKNATDMLESSKNVIYQAEKSYEISKTRYDSGMGTLVEMNDAEVALTQATLNYRQAIYMYLVAKSDYIKLLGTSF